MVERIIKPTYRCKFCRNIYYTMRKAMICEQDCLELLNKQRERSFKRR